jgi:hypothetical protein
VYSVIVLSNCSVSTVNRLNEL